MRAIAFALILLAGALAPQAARAHASLISSNPADGAVLAASPGRVVLTFNEPVAPLTLKLTNPVGETTPLEQITTAGAGRLIVSLPVIGEGTHLLSYRVISTDGHPIGGSLLFSIGRPTATRATISDDTDPVVRSLTWAARLVIYLGLFFGIGARFFSVWVARAPLPRRADAIVSASIMAALIAAALSIGLQGLDALGLPVDFIHQGDVWWTGLRTSYGLTAVVVIVALLLAPGRSQGVEGQAPRLYALMALAGVGLALALSGHASAAEPQWLTRPLVFVHAVCIVYWAGALAALGPLLRGGDGALMRFSRAIPYVLGALALAGLVLAIIQIGEWSLLWSTSYGTVFLLKMGAVAVLLVLAAANRFVLTPQVAAGAGMARMRAVIGAEVVAVVLILALVALWRFTPPPRVIASERASTELVHIHTEKVMAEVAFDPGHAGPVKATIHLLDPEFRPLAAKEVTLRLAQPAAGIEPLTRPARLGADGLWHVDGLVIPGPGRWRVAVDILVGDFDRVSVDAEVAFKP